MGAFGFRRVTGPARDALSELNVDMIDHETMTDILAPDDTRLAKVGEGHYIYLIRDTSFFMKLDAQGESIFDLAGPDVAEGMRIYLVNLPPYTQRALI